jgi:hypothetical protein
MKSLAETWLVFCELRHPFALNVSIYPVSGLLVPSQSHDISICCFFYGFLNFFCYKSQNFITYGLINLLKYLPGCRWKRKAIAAAVFLEGDCISTYSVFRFLRLFYLNDSYRYTHYHHFIGYIYYCAQRSSQNNDFPSKNLYRYL